MSHRFDPQEGLIVVPARLFGPVGDAVVRLALDTGATSTLVNTEVMVLLGYDPVTAPDRIQVTTGSGVGFCARLSIERIEAVGRTLEGFPILCHTLPLFQRGCLVLETFSVSHGKAYPYLPLIELLRNYFQITPQDDERKRREKVTGKVLTLDRSLEDTLPYLFFLPGVSEPTSSLPQMDPQIRRRRTFEAIKRLLLRESLNQPLILIFEDLHWLDAETQAFLTFLSESVATVRILLLVNYWPEYQHSWGSKTYYP